MFTKERAIQYLKGSGYPDFFIEAFLGARFPENLDIWIGVPKELYLCSESEQAELIPEGYEPLWDDGNFDAIYCATNFDKTIRKVYVEGGERVFRSYMEFAASIIECAWEAEFDEFIPEWASFLSFPYFNEAVDFLDRKDDFISYGEHERQYYKLIERLERSLE